MSLNSSEKNVLKSFEFLLQKQKNKFYLCKLYIDFLQHAEPKKINLSTGRLIQILCQHELGLNRDELLISYYDSYSFASPFRRESFKKSLEKTIQRSRTIFRNYHLDVVFDKVSKRYKLQII